MFGEERSVALGHILPIGREEEMDATCTPFLLGTIGNPECGWVDTAIGQVEEV